MFLAFPLVLAPAVQGEGTYIKNGIGDWGFDNFMDQAWEWVKNKVNDGVAWVGNGIVSIFENIRDAHLSVVNYISNFFGSTNGAVMLTANLIMMIIYVAIVFAVVRVWILVLDLLPIL